MQIPNLSFNINKFFKEILVIFFVFLNYNLGNFWEELWERNT